MFKECCNAFVLLQWLNRLLAEMWPYYDRGICKMVKEVVEPIIEQYRPPIFKKIFFQELTFGEAPFRVEGEQSFVASRPKCASFLVICLPFGVITLC